MGWTAWGGQHGMDSMGWTAWGGQHGMDSMGWAAWDGGTLCCECECVYVCETTDMDSPETVYCLT